MRMRIQYALLALLLAGISVAFTPGHVAHADYNLGYWNHKCVVQSTYSDETITFVSDDTWANYTCYSVLNAYDSPYTPFPTNADRPGVIQCAFIHRYGSGYW